MSTYAFLDQERTQSISAEDALVRSDLRSYYCPNPDCDGKIFIRRTNGIRCAHFAGRHVEGCWVHIAGGSSQQYTGDDFSLAELERRMVQSTSSKTKHAETAQAIRPSTERPSPPYTASSFYKSLKGRNPRALFGAEMVGRLLVDDRSIDINQKGLFGFKMVEGVFFDFNPTRQEIVLLVPHNLPINSAYNVRFSFSDQRHFLNAIKTIYNNRNNRIAVLGRWEKDGEYNHFRASVTQKAIYDTRCLAQVNYDQAIILNTKYEEKELVKELGARWSPAIQRWYVSQHIPDKERFTQWIADELP